MSFQLLLQLLLWLAGWPLLRQLPVPQTVLL
jgi:hypothetical protein